MSFESLRHIVSRTVRNPKTTKDLQVARIFSVTTDVISKLWGVERASYVTVISFAEGTLKLETASPSAKQLLAVDLQKIRNEINRQLGDVIVKTILVHGKGF